MSFVITTLKSKYDIHNPVEKKKVMHECFDLIRSVADLSITQHYLSLLSTLLEISDQIVLSQYKVRYKSNRSYQNQSTAEIVTTTIDTKTLLQALLINDNRKQYTSNEQLQQMIDYYKKLYNAQFNTENAENPELHN